MVCLQGPVNEDDGILIFGLYLDGARWSIEDGCLQDSKPGQRFSRLPELLLQPSTVCSYYPQSECLDHVHTREYTR